MFLAGAGIRREQQCLHLWSAYAAYWSMGLLSPLDWTADWIGYDAAYNLTPQQTVNNALYNTAGLSWIRFPAGQAQAGIEQSLVA